jgi:hypothetical protein
VRAERIWAAPASVLSTRGLLIGLGLYCQWQSITLHRCESVAFGASPRRASCTPRHMLTPPSSRPPPPPSNTVIDFWPPAPAHQAHLLHKCLARIRPYCCNRPKLLVQDSVRLWAIAPLPAGVACTQTPALCSRALGHTAIPSTAVAGCTRGCATATEPQRSPPSARATHLSAQTPQARSQPSPDCVGRLQSCNSVRSSLPDPSARADESVAARFQRPRPSEPALGPPERLGLNNRHLFNVGTRPVSAMPSGQHCWEDT